METERHKLIQADPWSSLRAFTTARIALGRTGAALPLKEVLAFRLAHAHARDAVYSQLEGARLGEELLGVKLQEQQGAFNPREQLKAHNPEEQLKAFNLQEQSQAFNLPVHLLHSSAADRYEYLQRPDKGRQLDASSAGMLSSLPQDITGRDLALVIADGLSATAVNIHAVPLLRELAPMLTSAGISLAPVCLVQQGRVAIGDEIGALLQVKAVVVLIGERPGLSAADSMGAYITYAPRKGLTDEARNCVSNIRQEGLQYRPAAQKIMYLLQEALRLQLSGVQLKDNADALQTTVQSLQR